MRLAAGVRLVSRPAPDNVLRLDQAALPMVDHMQRTGIAIDRDAFAELAAWLTDDMARLEGEIEQAVGRRVNPGSGDQVADLLFRELGLTAPGGRAPKLTKSGKRESTGKLELEPYLGQHPVVGMIFAHRERDKLRGTYAEGIPAQARPTDYGWRVHTSILTTRTATGRYSSKEPNLQNIPTRSKLGQRVRNCFIARPGRVLVSVDLSQIEMRYAAHESGAVRMGRVFAEDGDVHTETAMTVYGIPAAAVHPKLHRYPMKRAGFGILYGVTGKGLAVQLNNPDAQDDGAPRVWTEEDCDVLINQWYAANPEIQAWQAVQHQRARRYGMVWDGWGRVRMVPEVRSAHRWIVEAGLRQAGNMPIQAGAAGFMKLGMACMWTQYKALWAGGVGVDPIMQIHDDLLAEVDKGDAAWVGELTREVLEGAAVLNVPVRAEIKCGERWGELE